MSDELVRRLFWWLMGLFVVVLSAAVAVECASAANVTTEILCGNAGGVLRLVAEAPQSVYPPAEPLNVDASAAPFVGPSTQRYSVFRFSTSLTGSGRATSTRYTGWTDPLALSWGKFELLATGQPPIEVDCPSASSLFLTWRDETNPLLYELLPYTGWHTELLLGASGLVAGTLLSAALLKAF